MKQSIVSVGLDVDDTQYHQGECILSHLQYNFKRLKSILNLPA